jgi:chromosome transmission fidelity protein 4
VIGNPFSRKSGQETKKNPFARKPEFNKPIQKSESFFNKVEVAEGKRERQAFRFCLLLDHPSSTGPAAAKGKEREKKELSRQTTLFGLPSNSTAEKEKRVPKKKVDSAPEPKEDTRGSPAGSRAIDVEMQDLVQQEDATLVNGQSQSDPSNALTDTQPLDADDEPIDWPDSPQATAVNDDE